MHKTGGENGAKNIQLIALLTIITFKIGFTFSSVFHKPV